MSSDSSKDKSKSGNIGIIIGIAVIVLVVAAVIIPIVVLARKSNNTATASAADSGASSAADSGASSAADSSAKETNDDSNIVSITVTPPHVYKFTRIGCQCTPNNNNQAQILYDVQKFINTTVVGARINVFNKDGNNELSDIIKYGPQYLTVNYTTTTKDGNDIPIPLQGRIGGFVLENEHTLLLLFEFRDLPHDKQLYVNENRPTKKGKPIEFLVETYFTPTSKAILWNDRSTSTPIFSRNGVDKWDFTASNYGSVIFNEKSIIISAQLNSSPRTLRNLSLGGPRYIVLSKSKDNAANVYTAVKVLEVFHYVPGTFKTNTKKIISEFYEFVIDRNPNSTDKAAIESYNNEWKHFTGGVRIMFLIKFDGDTGVKVQGLLGERLNVEV